MHVWNAIQAMEQNYPSNQPSMIADRLCNNVTMESVHALVNEGHNEIISVHPSACMRFCMTCLQTTFDLGEEGIGL